MKPETQAEIQAALEARRKAYILALGKKALKEHIASQAEAMRLIGEGKLSPKDWMVINKSALDYSVKYTNLLDKEGASIIGGKKIPWMEDYSAATREKVGSIIDTGLKEGKSIPALSKELQEHFDGDRAHARMVARTELGRIQNIAKAGRWKDRGYTMVKIIDDEGPNSCEECRRVNGQIWTLDYFGEHELEHPSCVRTAVPVREGTPDEGGEQAPEAAPTGENE
jgi:SPP1 gp7 family putative phage head morphogenesis protein